MSELKCNCRVTYSTVVADPEVLVLGGTKQCRPEREVLHTEGKILN